MANKYVSISGNSQLLVEGLVTSAGAGDAGKIPALDSGGKLDTTLMPTGVGPDTRTIASSENLAAGDMVNIWDDAGTAKVRKADASNTGKRAHGFVLAAVTSPANATVYLSGTNDDLSGLTAGTSLFLSGGTAGAVTATAPTTASHLWQPVGIALSTTEARIEIDTPITLA